MNDTIVRIKRDCTELNSLGRATISITSSPRLYLCDCTVIKDAHAPLNIHRYTRLQDDRKICNSCYQSDKFRFPSFFFSPSIMFWIYNSFSIVCNYYCISIVRCKKEKVSWKWKGILCTNKYLKIVDSFLNLRFFFFSSSFQVNEYRVDERNNLKIFSQLFTKLAHHIKHHFAKRLEKFNERSINSIARCY